MSLTKKLLCLVLFLCDFAALDGPIKICGKKELEGTSCKLPLETNSNDVKWKHISSGKFIRWKNSEIRENTLGVTIGTDGSLVFEKITLNNSGTYTCSFLVDGGKENNSKVEIQVYAHVPELTVNEQCFENGTAKLVCDTGNVTDLTTSWLIKGDTRPKKIQSEITLTASDVNEHKLYMCLASNDLSKNQSSYLDPCKKRLLLGFDFWIMLSILTGGGTLLLLLICVLFICACHSCRKPKRDYKDEQEFRLNDLHPSINTDTNRSKHTARGQPAPPVPEVQLLQSNPSPQTTPQTTQTRPKPQIRARPPPPPQDDDEEDPPPLPRPRNKQHRKKNQEPYRPME